ncbi:SGNH/GDSL hydrolase family protein [Fusobacterium perfoetens]|uniref:SGNH/GDSL hydrolase family protein n=1 Tax=Fusobacterium perfoetens TaxID=852 RepID=UPI00048522AD|nr:SGNH/GDSL hydrolase family protein [Fusobacterium perfoetens]
MLKSKKEFYIRILIIIFLIGSFITFNYIIDPLQQYRIPKLYKIGYFRSEERYLNAGLIRNRNFDSILIGSSITRNFDENYIKKMLNYDIVKLTMSSANQEDIKFVLDSIDNFKIKNIMIGIDLWGFGDVKANVEMPKHLYKEKLTLKDNWKYLSNIGVFKQSLKLVLYNFKYKDRVEEKFKLGYQYKYSKAEVLKREKILNIKLKEDLNLENYSKEMEENYNQNLKTILEKNKDKNIILFFPPYSILAFQNMIKENTLEKYMAFKKFLVEDISKYKNVKIYDFQDVKEITHNFDNYGDKSHYSPEVSQKLIDFIKEDEYRITKNNVNTRIKNLEKQLKEMDYIL